MQIHVVNAEETLYSIASRYGLAMSQIIWDNGLTDPENLVVGEALVLRFPKDTYLVQSGDTLNQIAAKNQASIQQLLRNNPILSGSTEIFPGQRLVLTYQDQPTFDLTVNAYSYPNISPALLRSSLPFLTQIIPFTYGFTPTGALIEPDDAFLLSAAENLDVQTILSLSTLTENGNFSNELAHILLNRPDLQNTLIQNLDSTIQFKGYQGIEVDFEFVLKEDALLYADFIHRLHDHFSPKNIPILVDLAPKVYAEQPGLLYEGHNYTALGAAADYVLLMTYEWGYTYGPPMAVAPIQNVRQVTDYALREIPAEKIFLGIPTYGYDWILPFKKDISKAVSISNPQAISLARTHNAAIRYDETSQSPWFNYTDDSGQLHEVWFEDARSIQTKLALAKEKGLFGVNYWNLNRPFPQNWVLLDALANIRE